MPTTVAAIHPFTASRQELLQAVLADLQERFILQPRHLQAYAAMPAERLRASVLVAQSAKRNAPGKRRAALQELEQAGILQVAGKGRSAHYVCYITEQ